ncbi:hypothetical protein K502DRAFT_332544 [Neoconidiobolus thromboides FSU 785]|nr:hypothetical protein K502DRAFT_332544 [Neoconidiobolus thromboides FSU 785]
MFGKEKKSPLPPSYDEVNMEERNSNGILSNDENQKEIMNFVVKNSGTIERSVIIKGDNRTEYKCTLKTKSAEFTNKNGNVVLNLKECNFMCMYTFWEVVNITNKIKYKSVKLYSVIIKEKPEYHLHLIDHDSRIAEYKWGESKFGGKWKLSGPDSGIILTYKYSLLHSNTLKQFINLDDQDLDIFLFTLGIILNDTLSRTRQIAN